jgi:hypothetical protein
MESAKARACDEIAAGGAGEPAAAAGVKEEEPVVKQEPTIKKEGE